MTTIAYKKGVVACDRQGTDGNTSITSAIKMVYGPDSVFCITGTLTRGLKFTQWIVDGMEGKAPKLKGTIVFEMNLKNGKAKVWEDNIPLAIEDPYWAHGSGGDVALGAMFMGSTPKGAVKAATKHDNYTGRGVQECYSEAAHRRRVKSGGP